MNPFLALNMPGGPEILILFFLILILFGAKKLPELARGMGQAVNEFRKAKDDFNRELEAANPNTVQPQPNPNAQPQSNPPAPAPTTPAATTTPAANPPQGNSAP
jgi:sec-independent protein translocase protein TatA